MKIPSLAATSAIKKTTRFAPQLRSIKKKKKLVALCHAAMFPTVHTQRVRFQDSVSK
ncbi:hypothetical protein JYU34_004039 [Plutella xylostella]|uniref:Uncharacterized protein n=1 Tax=Plutella xylostella TaxID=51655 RepID=A0ABQ7QX12_PLUXY|nr:hypothetical protein JYU34_004039 [Plutella xylostella]